MRSEPMDMTATRYRARGAQALVALCLGLPAALWLAIPAVAQTKVPRVVVIANLENDPMREVFEQALARKGWIKGKNVAVEHQGTAGDPVRINRIVAEAVRTNVDVICAWSAPSLRAAYAATRTIPIVALDFTTDPVASGYAESYKHPGRNVTGVFLDAPEFATKWLDILKAVVPTLSRVAVVWDPSPGDTHLRALQRRARSLGIEVQTIEVRKPDEFGSALSALRPRPHAVVWLPSPMIYANIARAAEVTVAQKLPAIAIWREFARSGGAFGYGPIQPAYVQRSAAIVASVLGGAKPGDLPIERPLEFEFVVNVGTLGAMGLAVPDSVLLRANEVLP